MKVVNVHRRKLQASPERVGALLDSLSSPQDALSCRQWPRMIFDRPLAVGASGGHGPIGYFVEAYWPGDSIRFRFTAPKGLDGWHGFEVIRTGDSECVLEHRIEMEIGGPALLSWPLMFGPLHDALTEDALSQAQVSLGLEPQRVEWPLRVKLLRWLVSFQYRRGGGQQVAHPTRGMTNGN
jgi:hypothetical protein